MLRRTLILIILGCIVNGLLAFKGYHHTRFASVLGRIGLAWFFAGMIYLNNDVRRIRGQAPGASNKKASKSFNLKA